MKDKNENQSSLIGEMRAVLAASVGRIPAALVILLVVSIVAAALAGLGLKLATPSKTAQVFMPLRLEVGESSPAIDRKKLQGTWVYQTPDYAMTLTIVGDRFEWIIRLADIKDAQFFARGNFRIDGDVMVLGQRPDMGVPYDPDQPWIKFMPIAMTDINTRISQQGRTFIWDVPATEQQRIISHTAEIFTGETPGHFVWTKS